MLLHNYKIIYFWQFSLIFYSTESFNCGICWCFLPILFVYRRKTWFYSESSFVFLIFYLHSYLFGNCLSRNMKDIKMLMKNQKDLIRLHMLRDQNRKKEKKKCLKMNYSLFNFVRTKKICIVSKRISPLPHLILSQYL